MIRKANKCFFFCIIQNLYENLIIGKNVRVQLKLWRWFEDWHPTTLQTSSYSLCTLLNNWFNVIQNFPVVVHAVQTVVAKYFQLFVGICIVSTEQMRRNYYCVKQQRITAVRLTYLRENLWFYNKLFVLSPHSKGKKSKRNFGTVLGASWENRKIELHSATNACLQWLTVSDK